MGELLVRINDRDSSCSSGFSSRLGILSFARNGFARDHSW